DDVVQKLLALVEKAPDLRSRLEAAKALHRRGRGEGLTAMIRQWSHDGLPTEGGAFYDDENTTWVPRHPFLDPGWGVWAGSNAGELAPFLAATKGLAALAALIDKAEHGGALHRWAAMSAALGAKSGDAAVERLRRSVEQMLLAELGNKGSSGTRVGNQGID